MYTYIVHLAVQETHLGTQGEGGWTVCGADKATESGKRKQEWASEERGDGDKSSFLLLLLPPFPAKLPTEENGSCLSLPPLSLLLPSCREGRRFHRLVIDDFSSLFVECSIAFRIWRISLLQNQTSVLLPLLSASCKLQCCKEERRGRGLARPFSIKEIARPAAAAAADADVWSGLDVPRDPFKGKFCRLRPQPSHISSGFTKNIT